jgi:hypothetical protein
LFNIACAYAQAYCEGPDAEPGLDWKESHDKAIDYLRQGLEKEPDYVSVVYPKWTGKGESFECFANDPKFLALVTPKASSGTPGATPPVQPGFDSSKATGSGSVDVSLASEMKVGPPMVITKPATGSPGAAPASGSPAPPGDAAAKDPDKT